MTHEYNTPKVERTPLDEETISKAVRRVVDAWQDRDDTDVFGDFRQEIQREHPEIFGRLDDESLGILCSLVWLYLGHGTNKKSLMKWFRDSAKA